MGLLDYHARFYDPVLGRFLSPDSLVADPNNPLDWDRYGYVRYNPIINTDPTGHCIGPLLPVCVAVGTFIVDHAAVITAVAVTGAITSFTVADSPKPELVNDPAASQTVLDNAVFTSSAWLTFGSSALEFGRYSTLPKVNPSNIDTPGNLSLPANNESLVPEITTTTPRNSPNFIVTPNGDIIIVPNGATGPIPAQNGKGVLFEGGSGGNGLSSNASGVRIMNPTEPKPPSPGYPNGYASYYNQYGQTINPYTGQTIPRSDPWWHLPFSLK